MIEDNTEREPFRAKERVHLNEKFIPFDPKRTTHEFDRDFNVEGVELFWSLIRLETGVLPDLEFEIYGAPYRWPKGMVVTPFNPELGYQITQEDQNLQTRIEKFKRLSSELDRYIDLKDLRESANGIAFQIVDLREMWPSTDHERLFFEAQPGIFKLKPEILSVIRRLRLQIFFPTTVFESRPYETNLRINSLYFGKFYPLDMGPLPLLDDWVTETGGWVTERCTLGEGLNLHVPSDIDTLKKIKARFVLRESEKEQKLI